MRKHFESLSDKEKEEAAHSAIRYSVVSDSARVSGGTVSAQVEGFLDKTERKLASTRGPIMAALVSTNTHFMSKY